MPVHDRLLFALLSTPTSASVEPTPTASPGLPIPDTDVETCRLLGPTALVVQGLMGIFVILSLVWKRNHESPIRPWRIWCAPHLPPQPELLLTKMEQDFRCLKTSSWPNRRSFIQCLHLRSGRSP
jgi:hypothetical protein